jgi:hypothetical protein
LQKNILWFGAGVVLAVLLFAARALLKTTAIPVGAACVPVQRFGLA